MSLTVTKIQQASVHGRAWERGGGGDVDEAAGAARHDAGDEEPAELRLRGAEHACRRQDHGGHEESGLGCH